MIREQDIHSFATLHERFRSEATKLKTRPITAVFTLEQVSSVVKIRVTSPVRRCGLAAYRAHVWRGSEFG
jgi:hypothetical protein